MSKIQIAVSINLDESSKAEHPNVDFSSPRKNPATKAIATTHPLVATTISLLDRTLHKTAACLPYIGFSFMVYSAITAIYESEGERGTVLFVLASFTLLGLLHLCMHEFEKTRDIPSKKNELLKRAVWLLSVALTALFSYRVTILLDNAVLTILVWAVAVSTSIFGYCVLFLCK